MNHRVLAALAALTLLTSLAAAHETKTVGTGDEQYLVIVGFVHEPPFTEQRNGLDLIIRRAGDREPVEGLADSLNAAITSPDGTQTREFTPRARWGMPGSYTDDIVLTEAGVYRIRIWGFIGGVEFDETFSSHEVRALETLRFP
jgi:hypothetical protein